MFEELLSYCTENQRVCPKPQLWDKMHCIIQQESSLKVPSPLILAAWYHTSDKEKMLRLKDHIIHAHQLGLLSELNDFLRALSESDWFHVNE